MEDRKGLGKHNKPVIQRRSATNQMSELTGSDIHDSNPDVRKRQSNDKSNPVEDDYIDSIQKKQRSTAASSPSGQQTVQLGVTNQQPSVAGDQVVGAEAILGEAVTPANDDLVTLIDSQKGVESQTSFSSPDSETDLSKSISLPSGVAAQGSSLPNIEENEASTPAQTTSDIVNSHNTNGTDKAQDTTATPAQDGSSSKPLSFAFSSESSEAKEKDPQDSSTSGFVLNKDLSLFTAGQQFVQQPFSTTSTFGSTNTSSTFGGFTGGFQGFTFSAFGGGSSGFATSGDQKSEKVGDPAATGDADGDNKDESDPNAKAKQTAAFQSLFMNETGEGDAEDPVQVYDEVKLQPVEVKTGEEDDIMLYTSTARVYRLDNGNYKERGTCNISVNLFPSSTDPSKKRGRIVARNTVLQHVVINELIYPQSSITMVDDKPTFVRFVTISSDKQTVIYLLKFDSKNDSEKFLKASEKAKNPDADAK